MQHSPHIYSTGSLVVYSSVYTQQTNLGLTVHLHIALDHIKIFPAHSYVYYNPVYKRIGPFICYHISLDLFLIWIKGPGVNVANDCMVCVLVIWYCSRKI